MRRSECINECDGYSGAFPNIVDQGRPKTRYTGTTVVANARVDNTSRSSVQKLPCPLLGSGIAGRIQTLSETGIITNIVKFTSEVCQEVDEDEGFSLPPVDLLQFLRLVKCDFLARCLECECRVPRAAVRPIETAPQRVRMRECGIDNVAIRKSEYELPDRNPGQKPCLSLETLIGRPLQFEQNAEFFGVAGEPVKDAYIRIAVRGSNQAMGIVLKETRNAGTHLATAPPGIKKLPHAQHRR
jgi:hypothetical protein